MFLTPFLQLSAALLADADHLTVLLDVAHTHGLAALGADGHDLGCVHSTLSLDDTALLALTAGLDVLGNHVLALNDDLVLRGADLQDLTSVALVLAADDLNVVDGSMNKELIAEDLFPYEARKEGVLSVEVVKLIPEVESGK